MAKLPVPSLRCQFLTQDRPSVASEVKDDVAKFCLLLSLTPGFSMPQFHHDKRRTVGLSQSGPFLRIGKNEPCDG